MRYPKQLLHSFWMMAMVLMIQQTTCIQTQIEMDNSEVQATDVTYTFTSSLQNNYNKIGKLVIRFPDDFETPFGTIVCTAIKNFAVNGVIPCTYNANVRMLELTEGFPLKGRLMSFSVSGITNPSSATQSGIFSVNSYQQNNGVWVGVEVESSALTITTQPGSLQNELVSLPVDTMSGHYETLTLQATVTHFIPKDGGIQVLFPKWNPFADNVQQLESFVQVSTNPGQVKCTAIQGIPLNSLTDLHCQFSQSPDLSNPNFDILEVTFPSLTVDIAAGTQIKFSVEQVRGPPSTSPQDGFVFRTLSSNLNVIDQSATTISLQVSNQLIGSSALVTVTADNPSINVQTSLNFEIRTTNPLPPNSNISITIPDDFDISNIKFVSGAGALKSTIDNFTLDPVNRVLEMIDVNDTYIPPFVFIYLTVGQVTNPAQTFASKTFTVSMSNKEGGGVQMIDEGIFFRAAAGSLANVSIVSDELMINEVDVTYTFTIIPDDSFTSAAILKLTVPDQITVSETLTLTEASVLDMNVEVTTKFNQFVYFTNGFPANYDATLKEPIVFSLKGFTNPQTISTTDAFELAIYYEENVNEVTRYNGQGLTLTAVPSPMIAFTVDLSSEDADGDSTGFANTKFQVTGETVEGRPIQMGSYITLLIPADFKIPDLDRASSSCTVVAGFSDEITCSFIKADTTGYLVKIDGGFDSKTSMGGEFSFFMQEILNPFTTKETADFEMTIYDEDGGLQYLYQGSYRQQAKASQFSYAFAESSSTVVGESSIYQLTLTLSVDTPAGAQLKVTLPEELEFDANENPYCNASTNISPSVLPCEQEDNKNTIITLDQTALGSEMAKNGTTITVDIGMIKNPTSQKKTSSFMFSTLIPGTGTTPELINETIDGVTVMSPSLGPITINDVKQTGANELDLETAISISFKTTNVIPVGSQLQVTLSNNFIFGDIFEVALNGVIVPVDVNKMTFQLTLNYEAGIRRMLQAAQGGSIQTEQDFELTITKGLSNPPKGPYRYNYYSIQFSTADGVYGIDGVLDKTKWISQECIGNCDVCVTDLANCESCGLDRLTGTIPYYFEDNTCVQKCKSGFFGDVGYVCAACEYPCTECTMGAGLCTLCDASYSKPLANPLTLQCYDVCPDGTYEDTTLRQCLACQEPCFTCSSPTECLSCDRTDTENILINYFDVENTCYESCPAVSVPTPSKQCLACTENCKTCEDLTNKCVTCNTDYWLYKQTCVSTCPFGSLPSEDGTSECLAAGKMQIPLPFTIITTVISIGILISSFLKGSDKQGRMQQGTAFFITTLAFVDILLRINWISLIVYLFNGEYYITAGCYLLIMVLSMLINLKMWRRMFHNKYKYEDRDKLYSMYYANYPGTAKFIQNLSYLITFQAIRLTYSRILGKKQFMARFTTRRRYYRLIGRLSIMEIVILYLPSMAINIVNLFQVKKGSQLFYFDIDSLILVAYAMILIIVVLNQREKLLDQTKLFDWRDLFTGGELQEEKEVESSYYGGGFDVTGKFVDEQIEVHSAMDYEDKAKLDMYQLEWQFNSENKQDEDLCSPAKVDRIARDNVRPVSVFDYNEYRKLEDKKDRIVLKKELYDIKKEYDVIRNEKLIQENSEANGIKKDLSLQIDDLHKQLLKIQAQITETDRSRMREVKKAEQKKREMIVRKQGYEVPSLKSANDRSLRKKKDKPQVSQKSPKTTSEATATLPRNIHNNTGSSPNARKSMRSIEGLEVSETDATNQFVSSTEQFTLNRRDTPNIYTGNFKQSLDTSNANDGDEENQTIEQTDEQSLEYPAIASNEEGAVDQQPEAKKYLKSQHLTEGGSFGEKKE